VKCSILKYSYKTGQPDQEKEDFIMVKRHIELNIKLQKLYSQMEELVKEYQSLDEEYNNFVDDKYEELKAAGKDVDNDDELNIAYTDGEDFSEAVSDLDDICRALYGTMNELTGPSLAYASK